MSDLPQRLSLVAIEYWRTTGSLGGPIVQDKSHFYVAVERTDQEEAFTVNTGGVFPHFDGAFPREFWRNLFSIRWDQTISENHNLFARYAQQDEFAGCFNCGGTRRENAGSDLQIPRKALVVGLTSILSAQALNEFKFQRAFSMYQLAPSGTPIFTKVAEFPQQRLDNIQGQIVRPNVVDGTNFDELGPEHRWEFRDDFTYFQSDWGGEHNFKMGVDFSHIPFEDSVALTPDGGTYIFATNRPFDPDDPTTHPILYVNFLPEIYTRVDSQHLAFYFQDDWSPNSKLTFNLGIRYDRQYGSFNERRFSLTGMSDSTTYPLVEHLAFYFQDDWSPNSKLTFNLGIRYDRQYGSFERLDVNDYPLVEAETPPSHPMSSPRFPPTSAPFPSSPIQKTGETRTTLGPALASPMTQSVTPRR